MISPLQRVFYSHAAQSGVSPEPQASRFSCDNSGTYWKISGDFRDIDDVLDAVREFKPSNDGVYGLELQNLHGLVPCMSLGSSQLGELIGLLKPLKLELIINGVSYTPGLNLQGSKSLYELIGHGGKFQLGTNSTWRPNVHRETFTVGDQGRQEMNYVHLDPQLGSVENLVQRIASLDESLAVRLILFPQQHLELSTTDRIQIYKMLKSKSVSYLALAQNPNLAIPIASFARMRHITKI